MSADSTHLGDCHDLRSGQELVNVAQEQVRGGEPVRQNRIHDHVILQRDMQTESSNERTCVSLYWIPHKGRKDGMEITGGCLKESNESHIVNPSTCKLTQNCKLMGSAPSVIVLLARAWPSNAAVNKHEGSP